ncbi:MAG: 2-dehydropantoate 2-reductase, partial [Thaumarchaeota archaeon]|nr:2-dehydropantoate 2-reductase [Nitrososphaerota archaeon]
MKIGVVGAGGVGGYYGAKLALAGLQVAFLTRGASLSAIRESGLKLITGTGTHVAKVAASSDASEIGPVDLLLFCVKTYDTDEAMRSAMPLVGDGTTVLTLQNGVDNRERIAERVGAGRAISGACYVSSEVESPGVIRHKSGEGKVIFGEPDGAETPRVLGIDKAFASAGIPSEVSRDINTVLWKKMAWVCSVAGMNCISRLPIGPVMETEASRAMFRRMLREIMALANAEGATLPDAFEEQMVFNADTWDKALV